MHLGHSLRKLKTPLVDRMDYWYRLERLSCPLLPLEPVSSLTGGCSGDDSLISPGRKEDPGWDLCLRGEHPCPCHQDPFLSTDSSYLYFIFRCSHTVCFCPFFLFHRVEWNTPCESQCNGGASIFIFVSARRMKGYVFWSDLQISVLAFSVQLSN